MNIPREQIYSALFSALQSALLAPAGPFNMVGRRLRDAAQLAPPDRPALYQVQKSEQAETGINGAPALWTAVVNLVIYTSGDSDPNAVPSTELNSLLDSVESALKSITPGLAQSLGGRVSHCRIQGKIQIIENVYGATAMATVPVEVVTTA